MTLHHLSLRVSPVSPATIAVSSSFQALRSALILIAIAALLAWSSAAHAATFTVTTTADSGAGSLRAAVAAANAQAGNDSINFDPALFIQTLTIASPIVISSNVAIGATPTRFVTIQSSSTDEMFSVSAGSTVNLARLHLSSVGRIVTATQASVAMFECLVTSTSASTSPIFMDGGSLTVTMTTLANSNCQGALIEGVDTQLTMLLVTVAGNSTVKGAIHLRDGSTANFTHCSIAGNSASDSNAAALTLLNSALSWGNTVVAGNTQNGTPLDIKNDASTFTHRGVNFAGVLADSGLISGPTLLTGDAKFAPLGDYHGQVPNLALLPGSPLINAGTNIGASPYDQRLYPVVGAPDIGAFEAQASTASLSVPVTSGKVDSPLSCTVTVLPVSPEYAIPSGSVSVVIQGVTVGTGTLNAAGKATISFTYSLAGATNVSAVYNGNPLLLPCTSNSASVTFTKAESKITFALTSGLNPSEPGSPLTFTATVTPANPSSNPDLPPTGTVTFRLGVTSLGTVAVSAQGIAALTTSALPAGRQLVRATYNGNARFSGQSSTELIHYVTSDLLVTHGELSGHGSLVDALAKAKEHPGPDVISIAEEVTTISFPAEVVLDHDVTIDGSAAYYAPQITGDTSGTTNHRLFHILPGVSLTLNRMSLRQGHGQSSTLPGCGGAVLAEGTLNMQSSSIQYCSGQTGGGLYITSTGSALLDISAISFNVADQAGGVHCEGALTATSSSFRYNEAQGEGSHGGAIHALAGVPVSLTNVTFTYNKADNGGAIEASQLSVLYSLFYNNTAETGGAVLVPAGGTITLNTSMIDTNTATHGAGIQCEGSLTASTSCIVNNQAPSAGGEGGGINAPAGSTVSMLHCTVFNNNAATGGGIKAAGQLSLENSIVAGNTAPAPALANVAGSFTSRGFNVTSGNPVLAPVTYAPQFHSPAFDAAIVLSSTPVYDYHGAPRIIGPFPDVGAVEAKMLVVNTTEDELDPVGQTGRGTSLREAVRDLPEDGTAFFDPSVFSRPDMTLVLTRGPLNPQKEYTFNASLTPGPVTIVTQVAFTQHPQTVYAAQDGDASFTAAVTPVSGNFTWQWRKNFSEIAMTNSPTLTFTHLDDSSEGVYDVVVSEPYLHDITFTNVVHQRCNIVSQPAALVVGHAWLSIWQQPRGAVLPLNSSYTLSAMAVCSTPNMTYQWEKDGRPIRGATKSFYTFPSAQFAQAGSYYCVIKSGEQTPVTTDPVEIAVVDARPRTIKLRVGATFSVKVHATGNQVTWDWSGSNNTDTFTIPSVTAENEGTYYCNVYSPNSYCTVSIQLQILGAVPSLADQPPPPDGNVGQPYFWQITPQTTMGALATSFSIVGTLPPGLTLDKVTGVISGRPTASKLGGYPFLVKASNGRGSSAPSSFTIHINAMSATGIGTFAGPLERSPLNDNLGGRFDLATTSTGMFSGSVTLGTRKLGFKNQLLLSNGPTDSVLQATISGLTLPDKTPLTAYLEISTLYQTARLTLGSASGQTLTATAWRNPWLISRTVALRKPATAYAAYYTACLTPEETANAPRGYGFTSFTIAPAGTLTLAGKLPDGSAITGGTFVGPEGQILLFNLLYGNRGSNVGTLTIAPATPVTGNALAGNLSWFKPAPLPKSLDTIYKAGFGPLAITASGSPYSPVVKGAVIMGLTVAAPNSTNASLNFANGGIDFVQTLNISSKSPSSTVNVVGVVPPLQNNTKITSLNTATGQFSGTFTVPGATTALNRPATFSGQITTIDGTTKGWGCYLLPQIPVGTEKVTTAPKLSGQVTLSAPPSD